LILKKIFAINIINKRRNKMEERGKILCKKSDNKAFKMGENWYNLNDPVIPYLEKLSKGDEVVVTFEKKGVSRYVSKLVSASAAKAEAPAEEKKESSTGFACEVCGKELKDDKFKVCYMCNKKGLKPKSEASEPPKGGAGKGYYDNPEKTAQIQRGNALNAAATVASSQQFADPDVAYQFAIILAERFLEWLRAE
jgi:hypothetical protein